MQKLNHLRYSISRTFFQNIQMYHRFCTKIVPKRCWNCDTFSNDLLCPKCNSIQHPSEADSYFKLFNMDENYDVNQQSLTTKYRQLQAVLHPDRFSNKSQTEKDISFNYSALVNNAYHTLQKPLERALYMLRLYGERIDENDRGTDPNFLMEIMELNEEIEDAQTPDKLRYLNEKSKERLEEVIGKLSSCFKENNLKSAKDLVIQLKYYNSVSIHINTILRERGIVD